MKTITKLFLMTHHIPAVINSPDALKFYRTVARIHGLSLLRYSYGWVLA